MQTFLSYLFVIECAAPILESRELPVDYMALRISPMPSRCYKLSFGTSFAMVGHLGAEKNCIRHTVRKFIYRFHSITIYQCCIHKTNQNEQKIHFSIDQTLVFSTEQLCSQSFKSSDIFSKSGWLD